MNRSMLLELAEAEQAAHALFVTHTAGCSTCSSLSFIVNPDAEAPDVIGLCDVGERLVSERNELLQALLMSRLRAPQGPAES